MKYLLLEFAVFCLLCVTALCAEPPASIKPTSGVPQSDQPRAVCTFASIGLYWTPAGGADDKPCGATIAPLVRKSGEKLSPCGLINGSVNTAVASCNCKAARHTTSNWRSRAEGHRPS